MKAALKAYFLPYLVPYFVALLVMGLLDAVWLGLVASDFYREQMGPVMAGQVRWLPALLFYVGYPAGLVALALFPAGQPLPLQVGRAALVGLVAYGVYDLTNLATLRHWPVSLAVVDIAWGCVASALAGAAAAWVRQRWG